VKTLWIIASSLCCLSAVLFIVGQAYDKAFIAAALGAVMWFLSYRVTLREKFKDTDETDENDDGEEDQL